MTDQARAMMSNVAHPIKKMNFIYSIRSFENGLPQRKQTFESGFQAEPKMSLPQYLHFRSIIVRSGEEERVEASRAVSGLQYITAHHGLSTDLRSKVLALARPLVDMKKLRNYYLSARLQTSFHCSV
jgi:hypothetical protein